MVEAGVLIRGGVALGKLYVGAHLIFGEALVEAYVIESKEAIYPRVVVRDDIIRILHENRNDFVWAKRVLDVLRKDDDNRWYVAQEYPIYECLESSFSDVFEQFREI